MQKQFSFDIGSAFANLSRYLTTKDKLQLSATSKLLRQILLRGPIWQRFQIIDMNIDEIYWQNYLSWIERYLSIIEPYQLNFTIVKQQHEEDKRLSKILMQPRESVHTLAITTNSSILQLILANSCPNTTRITFNSKSISDELAEYMFQHFPIITEFEITSDTLEFTCKNITKYLKHPLEKLILKPYQLDYQQLIALTQDEGLNKLNQLEIDVEQCSQDELMEIIGNLQHISRLRLYHMEKFEHPDYPNLIASKLSADMKELTLTKCYYLDMTSIIERIASPFFQYLDITEANKLMDSSIILLAQKCYNLKHINISWCNELTNESVSKLIDSCPVLERVVLNGIKSISDSVFEEYLQFKECFNEKLYDDIKYEFRCECKKSTEKEIALIEERLRQKSQLSILFKEHKELFKRRRTLSNLRYLECISCNKISNHILKIIYCFNRMSQVINYYGDQLSLHRNTFEEDFID